MTKREKDRLTKIVDKYVEKNSNYIRLMREAIEKGEGFYEAAGEGQTLAMNLPTEHYAFNSHVEAEAAKMPPPKYNYARKPGRPKQPYVEPVELKDVAVEPKA
ncbi:hypothetical protein MUN82_01830 [Hymenobacter aerilatus]|uniref:Uncharacterized protein n=1 Tax=Hymenobacter aerilatus TaxID=2932251 RepID=A0A8T9T034_9BACT|nr:hypothetical protein [Hymenobacter aerilatus]UOR05850.1 hypothetical protein MUN82_01830 [Hymenobacter aerilatus]